MSERQEKDLVRDALTNELCSLEVEFKATGVRREDGIKAVDIMAEQEAALQEEEKNGRS